MIPDDFGCLKQTIIILRIIDTLMNEIIDPTAIISLLCSDHVEYSLMKYLNND